MKKLNKNQKIIVGIAIILLAVILAIIVTTNVINSNVGTEGYSATTANANSNLVAGYIKEGITIGGITGTLESLNTFDATATAEDIAWGETAYVKGEKITGTKIITVAQGKVSQKVFEENTSLIDDYQNKVVIPSGFKIAEDSATAVEDGIVIEDKDGNQFVWIPANTEGVEIKISTGEIIEIIYKRTSYLKENIINSFKETMPSDEQTSVNKWNGFYIGRFEAGDKESTMAKTMRSGVKDATITIKKDQVPYNYILPKDAKAKAENMHNIQEYLAITKLVSSYAWDTTIDFIQKTNSNNEHIDYGINSPEGNYSNTAFTYTDLQGIQQIKKQNERILVPTGQTTAVNNIYDMGGNLWEYTTEGQSSLNDVGRGGTYYDTNPAGYRAPNNGNAIVYDGFRVTLFI